MKQRIAVVALALIAAVGLGTQAFGASSTSSVAPGDSKTLTCSTHFTGTFSDKSVTATCAASVPTTTTTPPTTTTTQPPITTTTTRPPVTTTTQPPPPPPGGNFTVSGGKIHSPNGSVFVPIGANVGTASNFDWKGVADGNSAAAVKWGWNTVRLNVVFAPLFAPTATTIGHVESIADEYTAKGIVVIVTSHDALDSSTQAIVNQSFTTLATKYKSNPRVWFDGNNEPQLNTTAEWVSLQKGYLNLVRAAGDPSIVVGDAIADAEDAGWDPGFLKDYAGGVGGANFVVDIHNYGSYVTGPDYVSHMNVIQSAGLAVFTGETGYQIGEVNGHTDGTNASFSAFHSGFGVLAWHGTHGDGYTLMADGGPFYEHTDGTGLSAFGASLWALGHGG